MAPSLIALVTGANRGIGLEVAASWRKPKCGFFWGRAIR